jgi:hypothetical protein
MNFDRMRVAASQDRHLYIESERLRALGEGAAWALWVFNTGVNRESKGAELLQGAVYRIFAKTPRNQLPTPARPSDLGVGQPNPGIKLLPGGDGREKKGDSFWKGALQVSQLNLCHGGHWHRRMYFEACRSRACRLQLRR